MRRGGMFRVGLTVAVAAAVVMAGGIGIAHTAQPESAPTIAAQAAPAPVAAPAAAATTGAAAKVAGSVGVQQDGDETVGVMEAASQAIDYRAANPSLVFTYPGASYVKVHFAQLVLLPGDYVTVTDAKGRQESRYAGTVATLVNSLAGSGRWAMSVDGDTAKVELHRAGGGLLGLDSLLGNVGVSVDQVARGYTAKEKDAKLAAAREAKKAAGRARGVPESLCGGDEEADAACYKSSDPVAYNKSKAVARLLIGGNKLCTAWRVGKGNRMLTNNHCFTSTSEAQDTEVWFNYECAKCGGWEVLPTTKVWAYQVLATNRTLDYTLFTVENFSSIAKFGWLDLDLRTPARGEQLYIPQHPAGDPTVISMDAPNDRNGNCQVDDPRFDGNASYTDVSYYCDTEGGSSGSPVISRLTNKVIALHHFGGCPNSGVRIDLIYKRIQALL